MEKITNEILEEVHITNIAVSPEFRRQKVGERLLKRIIPIFI